MTPSSPTPRRSNVLMTSHANVSSFYPESLGYRLKSFFLGKPYVSEQLAGERLSKVAALGVLSSDCISSSAYGTEEILTQLTPVIGLAAFSLLVPIMFVILGVLVLVALSYLDVIKRYVTAGGSYSVTRDNFGPRVAQVAAVALLIDYIVTVAVQCSAGTATLTSAIPALVPYTVEITVGVILLFLYGNLRGIREAGTAFALPTYLFVSTLFITIAVGIFKEIQGTLHTIPIPPHDVLVGGALPTSHSHGLLYGVAFITLLRAYANGGSSLTGLEAISNGVQAFRRPESHNARIVMVIMAGILGTLLLGVTFLARWTHALPYEKGTPTVLSQEVLAIFGSHGFGHIFYYLVLAATTLILFTGGNTSFNGFPYLANYVATDQYLPRQLTKRGHRLAFSNGIIALAAVALVLTIAFNAQVNGLIALYAIGVFTAFTMAGAGMTKKHLTEKGKGWRRGVAVNAASASVSLLIALVFAVVKFSEGAWVVVIAGPIMFWLLVRLNKQYTAEDVAFTDLEHHRSSQYSIHRVVVFVDTYDVATERALQYAMTLTASSVRAVHFDIDPRVTAMLLEKWGEEGTASSHIDLEIADCEDRRIDRAALEMVADICRDSRVFCMVILPRRGVSSRLTRLLHDRTADAMAAAVMFVPRAAATILPYRVTVGASGPVATTETTPEEILRGGVREDAHLEPDLKLAAALTKIETRQIGTLNQRDHTTVAGRVRSMTLGADGVHELKCQLADASGSITLVFQGRNDVPGIERGTRLIVTGTVTSLNREAVIMNPEYEIVSGPASDD